MKFLIYFMKYFKAKKFMKFYITNGKQTKFNPEPKFSSHITSLLMFWVVL